MVLKTKKVNWFLPEYTKIKQLMKRAFPTNEQFPIWLLMLHATKKGVDFFAYYDNETFCGISYTAQCGNMVFVLYLAVNDMIRSKGYGSDILTHIKNSFGEKSIFLNVEPLDTKAENYTQRARHIAFYMKNRFSDTHYMLEDRGDSYLILFTAEKFFPKEYTDVLKKLSFGSSVPTIKPM